MDLVNELNEFKRLIRRLQIDESDRTEYMGVFYPVCLRYLRAVLVIMSEMDTSVHRDYVARERIIRKMAEITIMMQRGAPNNQ